MGPTVEAYWAWSGGSHGGAKSFFLKTKDLPEMVEAFLNDCGDQGEWSADKYGEPANIGRMVNWAQFGPVVKSFWFHRKADLATLDALIIDGNFDFREYLKIFDTEDHPATAYWEASRRNLRDNEKTVLRGRHCWRDGKPCWIRRPEDLQGTPGKRGANLRAKGEDRTYSSHLVLRPLALTESKTRC